MPTPHVARIMLGCACSMFALDGASSVVRAQVVGDFRPAWSPDGRHVAFQSTRDGNDEIYSVNVDEGGVARLTDHLARDAQPSWSPDGTRIVFASDRGRDSYSGRAAFQLYTMRSDGSDVQRLTDGDSADFMPRWSPDDEWIAFLSDRTGALRLYVMPSAGGEARDLLPAGFSGTPGNPTWSADSRRVGFDASTDDGYDIFSVHVESADVVNHTRSRETEWYPAWSPDGATIAAGVLTGTLDDGTHQLVALHLASGRRSAITRPTPRADRPRDWWPTWSPDGARLVFASRRDGPWRLFVIGADGTNERRLPTR